MNKLDEFRTMIDKTDDQKVLESGQELLRDMINLSALRQKVAELEEGLTDGGKAIFYFFAEELDEDEIVFAAERISGRIKRLDRKAAKESKKKEEKATEDKEGDEVAHEGEVHVPFDNARDAYGVFVVDEDLDGVSDFVFVAHGGAWCAPDGVEDMQVEEVEAAAFEHVFDVARFFDDAADGFVIAEEYGEVFLDGLDVLFLFDGEDGGRVVRFEFVEDVA